MSRSISELRRSVVAVVFGFVVATVAFHDVQNRFGLIGGGISLAKAAWLAEALFLWLVLPAFVLADTRTPAALRTPFRFLLWWMGARAVVEAWMLYVAHNWSPLYGIAHDMAALCALWFLAWRAWRASAHRQSPTGALILRHAIVTGLLFIPEMYFAWYMWSHFDTTGGRAVYFVPDDLRHQFTLAVTASVDAALVLYLLPFLWYWLHGQAHGTRARA